MITVQRTPTGWSATFYRVDEERATAPLPLTPAATIEDAIAHMQRLFPDSSVSGSATPAEYAAIAGI